MLFSRMSLSKTIVYFHTLHSQQLNKLKKMLNDAKQQRKKLFMTQQLYPMKYKLYLAYLGVSNDWIAQLKWIIASMDEKIWLKNGIMVPNEKS